MDYESYKANFFVDPPPQPRFDYIGLLGTTLYFEEFEQAVGYYSQVLGHPVYQEGAGTRGWRIGSTWLTLLAHR